MAARNPAWTEVNQFSPTSAGWRTVPTSLAVGFQNFQPPTRVRSLVRFALDSHMFGAHVLSGTLNVFENWSSSCQARAIDVGVVSGFSSATTWNNQPVWPGAMASATVAHGHDAGCPQAGIDFNVTAGVVHSAAAHTGISFELRAHDENDALAWK